MHINLLKCLKYKIVKNIDQPVGYIAKYNDNDDDDSSNNINNDNNNYYNNLKSKLLQRTLYNVGLTRFDVNS